ncbi:SusC/RagA family TonB-linked outer membrane protein [Salegentibacter salinarum]|uniref:SusC/RagA family TonB-linked outer membrane protein n=1 Tax=Salegentibacter salinarum TaxID=447422 RepID=A0A2N0TW79_9FLAO|nr:SusC/RagA family TonB-linked outer membrane protein [Salegentibacter salinarum]PKD19003.1 SusC/RagA family TonB-linked outer membrane protein [Salegentibacter salinarum]SKB96190.1 TonB-linked outer membrane protein, SusC/RagA family [Salegentibacter salinarum]
MKNKLHGILTLLLAFVVQFTFAQEKLVTGTVVDEDGLPLPGVNVIEKGTNNGSQTNFDGQYSLSVDVGDIIVFSYVGFRTQEITVGEADVYDVTLGTDAAALDEVVVVGYGTATRQSFTGTATTIDGENLEGKNFSNVTQALAGEVAGVNVINNSGQPGTTSTVRVRGFGSINGNRAPLYVIDGVPLSSGDPNSDAQAAIVESTLNSINPADIESTTVLKDATATAIYGSRGANGVILINTKSGRSGESYIEVDVKTGVNNQWIPRYDVISSPEQYIGAVWEGIYNRGVLEDSENPVQFANERLFSNDYVAPGYNMWNVEDGGELINPDTRMVRDGVTRRYTPERYEDAAFQKGALRKEANVRFGGGSDKTTYFASVGYLDEEGTAINTGYERYSTRLNLKSDVKDWLEVSANMGYAYSERIANGQTDGAENLFEFSDKMAPIFPVFLRDDAGNLVADPIFGGNQYDYGSASTGAGTQNPGITARPRPNANNLNPIGSALYDFDGTDRHEMNGNFALNFILTENLTFETRFGAQYFMSRNKDFRNPFYGGGNATGGDLITRDYESLTTNWLKLLRYENQWGDHSIEALVAHENNEFDISYSSQYKGTSVSPDIYELNNFVDNLSPPTGFVEGRALDSYFGQINYNYLGKYYFSGSLRRDGSSRFVNDKWGTFGSAGVSWVASNEDFLANNDLITFLKLKTSYGITGDEAGVGYYAGYDTFSLGTLGGGISITQRDNGNPNLTWETSKMYQAGVEFSLGRFLDATVDYYIKDTEDQIFERRVGPSQGIAIIDVNDGDLRNSGLEFNLTGHLVTTEDFSLDLNINGEVLSNKITAMPIEPSTGEPRVLDTSPTYFAYSDGGSIFDFYMREWAGVNSENGAPQWYRYFDDVNGNGTFDEGDGAITDLPVYLDDNPGADIEREITETYSQATNKFIGKSAIPDVRGAIRLGGRYKSFDFSTQLLYSLGGHAYDAQYGELMSDRFGAVGNNYHTDIAQRWQEPGDVTNVPRLSDAFDVNSTATSSRFLTSTDYVALNNARIGYTISEELLGDTGINFINIFFSGDNLWAKTARDGFLPFTRETGNSGRALYAPLTTITAGVRVKF